LKVYSKTISGKKAHGRDIAGSAVFRLHLTWMHGFVTASVCSICRVGLARAMYLDSVDR